MIIHYDGAIDASIRPKSAISEIVTPYSGPGIGIAFGVAGRGAVKLPRRLFLHVAAGVAALPGRVTPRTRESLSDGRGAPAKFQYATHGNRMWAICGFHWNEITKRS